MKKVLHSMCLMLFMVLCPFQLFASTLGETFKFDFKEFKEEQNSSLKRSRVVYLPLKGGEYITFELVGNGLSGELQNIKTFSGVSIEGDAQIRLSLFEEKIEAIIYKDGDYLFVDPENSEEDLYRIYSLADLPTSDMLCLTEEGDFQDVLEIVKSKKQKLRSGVQNYPIGDKLRVFRFAGAATGEMVAQYGSKDAALAMIVSVMNLSNLIYEMELSITFRLIDETLNGTLLFTNPDTDPFDPDPSFASASRSQTGYTTMHNDGILDYSKYDVGHTFNTLEALGAGYSANGQAGPYPCVNTTKARGWTQWTNGSPAGFISGIFVHEVGHQFTAWHTYNANGGTASSPTFCTSGWSAAHAVEPGAGSTLMGYARNCVNPVSQTLSGQNNLQYFHSKSLEAIEELLQTEIVSCYTLETTGNTPPSADAGVDITIPKGTPFMLKGKASDVNGDELLYAWEQCDVAVLSDRGALGYNILGEGGYAAVNSKTAPLFRSEQSANPERIFPKMKYVLENGNIPGDNEGEALPMVDRNMTFRFVVRDQKGGVDMDEVTVAVGAQGPLTVTLPTTGAEEWSDNSSQTITWDVNSTNELSASVDILLSVDGGNSFPYVLAENTLNDGNETVQVPIVPSTTEARVKVVARLSDVAEFFDVSDNNFVITSTCSAYGSQPAFVGDVKAEVGSEELNLNMGVNLPIKVIQSLDMAVTGGSNLICIRESHGSDVCHPYFQYTSSPLQKIRVTENGTYTLTNNSPGSIIFSVFNDAVVDCSSFVGSNSYWSGNSTSTYMTKTATVVLEAHRDYYFYCVSFSPSSDLYNIEFVGGGDVYIEQSVVEDVDYAYVAINNSTGKVDMASPTADFRGLDGGLYTVYGLSYDSSISLSDLKDKTKSEIQGGECALFSSTSISMEIGNPTNIEEENRNPVFVYPTIVSDLLYIVDASIVKNISVWSTAGEAKIKLEEAQKNEVSLKDLPSGVYFVEINTKEGEKYIQKIIKK